MSWSITQFLRAWLIAFSCALVLFLGNIAVEVLSDDLKEKLKPYQIWIWGFLGLSLLVTLVGAIREIKNQRDSEKSADNNSAHNKKNIKSGSLTGSIQNTGDKSIVNQESGIRSNITLTLHNNPPSSQQTYTDIGDKRYTDEISKVSWEYRDTTLLKKYFLLCSKDDDQYRDYERWQERTIRERLIICGFALEGTNGQTYLTKEGVLFCCQHGQIPQSSFFVDVRLKYDNSGIEKAIQYNNHSLLSLYFSLLEQLAPLYQQGIEVPGIRDPSGRAVVVYEYPQLAIIEALVNFLIHRDYTQDDVGFITIYPNKIVFENPGQSEFPVEELLNATGALKPKYCRNQRLIQAFNYARLNQREGRGIQRIKESLEKNGSYLPDGSLGLQIQNDDAKDRFIITLHKRELPTTPLLGIGAWLWDKYGKTVTDKAAGTVKDKWNKFKWKGAAEAYRAKIKKLYGTMQIMGMAEPVPLDDIFTDAYMLDQPTAFGRFDIESLKQSSADLDAPPQAQRINGLRLVKEKGNLFILGKPGAGKTTFLKYIAVQAAERIKPVIDKVPIFISLKQWADSGAELMPFITERFDICDFPDAQPFVEELLNSGNAIVLFDGLDEVNQESGQRDKQTRAMNNFIEKYDQTQCLITCRLAASDYSFQPFTYVEIADFTEKQIKKFVGNWFRKEGEKDEETRDKFLAEFAKADNKGLRDLARTPLLLTLLCLAFNETLTFPQRRVEIYEEAVDALLKKWDSSRRIKRDEVYRQLSLGHKENMLARIAAQMFEKNEYFIPQAELERYITDYVNGVPPHDTNEVADGEVILKAIEAQHGIFVERAREVYSFSHMTFQEYFTAKYIVANTAKGTLTNLIKEHCTDESWREVFLLTTSLLPDASQFIKTFRCNVDELLEGDEKLRALLALAEKKVEWWVSGDKLRTLMIKPRDIGHEWDLTDTQEAQLGDYLNATSLLRDCLDLAFMPPDEKKEIQNSLYLPPAQVEDGQNA